MHHPSQVKESTFIQIIEMIKYDAGVSFSYDPFLHKCVLTKAQAAAFLLSYPKMTCTCETHSIEIPLWIT